MWDARAEADRWYRQADNDLAFARIAVREGFHAQACFIAQQAAEKAVKSIAYGLGERTVIGHSLVVLGSRYADRVPELQALREHAGVLDQYYVPTRYPSGLAGGAPFEAFGESQASAAVDAAERFVRLAERLGQASM